MQNDKIIRIRHAMMKDIAVQDAIIRDVLESIEDKKAEGTCVQQLISELVEAEVRQKNLKTYLKELKDNSSDKFYMDMIESLEVKLDESIAGLYTRMRNCLIFATCSGIVTLIIISICYYIRVH